MGIDLSSGLASKRIAVIGGAGFIGSHFVDRLLSDGKLAEAVVFDNFSAGTEWHLRSSLSDTRLRLVRGDVKDLEALTNAMIGVDVVIHLASNPDIAKAMTDPTVDFDEGTLLTNNVVEAMRRSGVPEVLYASGSGIYGDVGHTVLGEDHGPLLPSSTYGASKLAGEAVICAYAHMFSIRGRAFRFGNVVGPRQTHGVGLDFVRRLTADPTRLRILGDGSQSKPYVHVDDIVSAVLLAWEKSGMAPFDAFNVSSDGYVTVNEIAEAAVQCVVGGDAQVNFEYTGGNKGWKGDVPIVRLDSAKIRALGWQPARSSIEAIQASLRALLDELPMRTEAGVA